MAKWNRLFAVNVFFIICCHSFLNAQVFLQIEKINSPKTIKLIVGDNIEYRTKEYPDTWVRQRIQYILPEENKVILDEGIFEPEDFKDIRLYRNWARFSGNQLMTFSGVWFVYGGIAAATSDFEFNKGDVIIGMTPLVTGFFIKKAFYKRRIKLGKNGRLRILDIRMPGFETQN